MKVNGQKIETSRELTRIITGFHVGEVIKISVLRDGKEKTFNVKIAKREDTKNVSRGIPNKEQEAFGIQVSNLTPEIARRLKLRETKGVVVTGVQENSEGEDKGVQTRDIIMEINHQSINTITDYENAIRKVKKGNTVTMFIKRANSGFFVIKLTKD
jgi:serine protease Do